MIEHKSKLEIIQSALERRAKEDIIIVKKEDGSFSPLIRYWIAPKKGIYLAHELQNLMIALVPELKPYRIKSFRYELKKLNKNNSFLDMGHIIYNKEVENEKINQIILRLFPNKKLAEEAFENNRNFYIHLQEIKKYCPNIEKISKRYEKEKEIKERELERGRLSISECQIGGGDLSLV